MCDFMIKIAAQSDNCADISLLTFYETVSCEGPTLVGLLALLVPTLVGVLTCSETMS